MLEKLIAANQLLKNNGVMSDEAAGVLIALCDCLDIDLDLSDEQYKELLNK